MKTALEKKRETGALLFLAKFIELLQWTPPCKAFTLLSHLILTQ